MKRVSCMYCGKTFHSNHNLIRHERIHTGEKPFECELCHTRFNVKSSLHRHYNIHYRKDDDKKLHFRKDK